MYSFEQLNAPWRVGAYGNASRARLHNRGGSAATDIRVEFQLRWKYSSSSPYMTEVYNVNIPYLGPNQYADPGVYWNPSHITQFGCYHQAYAWPVAGETITSNYGPLDWSRPWVTW